MSTRTLLVSRSPPPLRPPLRLLHLSLLVLLTAACFVTPSSSITNTHTDIASSFVVTGGGGGGGGDGANTDAQLLLQCDFSSIVRELDLAVAQADLDFSPIQLRRVENGEEEEEEERGGVGGVGVGVGVGGGGENGVGSAALLSAAATTRIGYYKTHKTASSTLGSIFFRYAMRRQQQPYRFRGHVIKDYTSREAMQRRADSVLKHLSGAGDIRTEWKEIAKFYRTVLGMEDDGHKPLSGSSSSSSSSSRISGVGGGGGGDGSRMGRLGSNVPSSSQETAAAAAAAAASSAGVLVTIVREPVQHYLSYYFFYVEPTRGRHLPLTRYVSEGRGANGLAREFGLTTESAAHAWVQDHGPDGAGGLGFIALSDRMDESLVAMALDFGWSLADASYARLLDSHSEAGAKRWDGKPLKPTPKESELPPEMRDRVRELVRIDKIIYDHAAARLDDTIARHGRRRFERALLRFKAIQAALGKLCGCDRSQGPHDALEVQDFCRWYALTDTQYERYQLSKRGVKHLPGLRRWWRPGGGEAG